LNSPFNERKYKSLLKGLEASEVRLCECQSDLFRLEAEYFKKEYSVLEKTLQNSTTLEKKA